MHRTNERVEPILAGLYGPESLDQIIARKQKEITDAGVGFWGYAGNLLAPKCVQAFVERYGSVIRSCNVKRSAFEAPHH
jgi:hypothetical protein